MPAFQNRYGSHTWRLHRHHPGRVPTPYLLILIFIVNLLPQCIIGNFFTGIIIITITVLLCCIIYYDVKLLFSWQAPDVSWNSPFKVAYRELYEQWLVSGEKTFTKGGNMRPPTRLLIVQWVKKAWESLPVTIIQKSFKVKYISIPFLFHNPIPANNLCQHPQTNIL